MMHVVGEESVLELGIVSPSDTPLKKSFTIRNIGTGDLVIQDVRVSCGCSQATVQPKRVRAGSACELMLLLDAYKLGEHHASAVLMTNAPGSPEARFAASWTVSKGVVANPGELLGLKLNTGEQHSESIALSLQDGIPATELSARSVESNGANEIQHCARIEGDQCLFSVALPEKTADQYDGTVEILHRESVLLVIPWSIQVQERVQASPDVAYFRRSPRGDYVTQLVIQAIDEPTLHGITVKTDRPSNMEFKQISSTVRVANVSITEVDLAKAKKIDIFLPDGELAQSIVVGR
jgi:hypothetical protein